MQIDLFGGQREAHSEEQSTDDCDYELIFSNRKSIAVYVYPGGRVLVRAPHWIDQADIDHFLAARWGWIETKKAELALQPTKQPLQFVDRAPHHFLGNVYELRIARHRKNGVYRVQNNLVVTSRQSPSPDNTRKILIDWYRQQGAEVYRQSAEKLFPYFAAQGLNFPTITVRRFKARWGSCSRDGQIALSLDLVRYPEPLIDYVVLHELCHLIEFNHSKRFYNLMVRLIPDWKERKTELEKMSLDIGNFA